MTFLVFANSTPSRSDLSHRAKRIQAVAKDWRRECNHRISRLLLSLDGLSPYTNELHNVLVARPADTIYLQLVPNCRRFDCSVNRDFLKL